VWTGPGPERYGHESTPTFRWPEPFHNVPSVGTRCYSRDAVAREFYVSRVILWTTSTGLQRTTSVVWATVPHRVNGFGNSTVTAPSPQPPRFGRGELLNPVGGTTFGTASRLETPVVPTGFSVDVGGSTRSELLPLFRPHAGQRWTFDADLIPRRVSRKPNLTYRHLEKPFSLIPNRFRAFLCKRSERPDDTEIVNARF